MPAASTIVGVAEFRPGLLNVSVYVPAIPPSPIAENVATPPVALEVSFAAPITVAPALTLILMRAVLPVTRLFAASRTATTGCVVNAAPLAAPAAAVVTTS